MAAAGTSEPATSTIAAPIAASIMRRLRVGAVAATSTNAGPRPTTASGQATSGARTRCRSHPRACQIHAETVAIHTSPAAWARFQKQGVNSTPATARQPMGLNQAITPISTARGSVHSVG